MGKVIAFDRNRLRNKPHSANFARRASSQLGAGGGTQIYAFSHKKEEIGVSIVLPAHGRPQQLSRCLASLLSQQFADARYEIIVVDAEFHPSTRDIVNDWAHHASRGGPSLTYLAHRGKAGAAAARNRGWRAARGQIVAFIDEDVLVRSDWLQKAWGSFESDVQAVWGRIMSATGAASEDNTVMLAPGQQQAFETSNFFVKKETLRELGGFDERFTSAWGEEADLYFRLASHSARVVHHSRLIASHEKRPVTGGKWLSRQRQRQWDALLYKKHPQLYRQKIRRQPYAIYYPLTLTLMLAVFSFLAGAMVLGAVAAAIWGGLTLRYQFQERRRNLLAHTGTAPGILASILNPPLAVFWHVVGMLRFRTAFL